MVLSCYYWMKLFCTKNLLNKLIEDNSKEELIFYLLQVNIVDCTKSREIELIIFKGNPFTQEATVCCSNCVITRYLSILILKIALC